MSDEYTPTTEEISDSYSVSFGEFGGDDEVDPDRLEAFNRWLRKHDADVWQEGVTDAIWNAEHSAQPQISNPYREDMK
jgi:hypothetical protein